jgi:excisionase family DNA binding protein
MTITETHSGKNNAKSDFSKPIWVSPRRASQLTGIGLTRLYELLNDGTVQSRKVGRRRLVSYASLEALGSE